MTPPKSPATGGLRGRRRQSACLTMIFLSACAVGHRIHYYVIDPPNVAPAAGQPNGIVLLVGRIAAPEALEGTRIRYRSGNEVGGYELNRWEEAPPAMIQDILTRTLRATGQYRQVLEAASDRPGDFLLRGRLFDFSEVDEPTFETRISLRLELIDRKTGQVLWDRRFDRVEPVGARTIPEVVASFQHNLQGVASEASADVGSYFASHR